VLSPKRPPDVLLVCGAPASGKSTLGRAVAARLGAALLDIDTLTGPLTAVVSALVGVDDFDSPVLAQRTRGPRYLTLQQVALDNVLVGQSVVLVAPFTAERRQPAALDAFAQPLAAAGGRPRLVWLHLPGAELIERMRSRAAQRDRIKLADDGAYLAGIDLDIPRSPHLAVDATSPLAGQVAQVERALGDAVG